MGLLKVGNGTDWLPVNGKQTGLLVPQTYGAVGDGVADDTAALMAWMTDLINMDREGYLPAGTYRVTSSLNFRDTSGRLCIKGAGARLSFLYGDFIGAGQGIIDISDVTRQSGFHRLTGIGFLGNNVPGDPIGILAEHGWSNILEDISAPNISGVLCNSLIHVTKDNNSKYRNIHTQGGWQPRAFPHDNAALCSFTVGDQTITSTHGIFTTNMVGQEIFFADGSDTGSHNIWASTITSRTSSTVVEIADPAPSTASGVKFRVGKILGSINAGSNQLTIANIDGLTSAYVGMSVHVVGAALKSLQADNAAVLTSRIQSVSGNVITLEATAKATVSNASVLFAPAIFVGDHEDDPSSLETNHSWWSDVHCEGFPGVGLVVNSAQYVVFDRLKLHGASYSATNDWGECQFGALLSDIESLTIRDVQCNYGVSGTKIHISGSWGVCVLENVEFGHLRKDIAPIRIQSPDDCFRLQLGKVHTFALTNFPSTWRLVNQGNYRHVSEMYGTMHIQDMMGRYTPGPPAPVNPGVTGVHEGVAVSNGGVFKWVPPGEWGILHLACTGSGCWGLVHYRLHWHSSGVECVPMSVGGNVDVLAAATTLTGTTGTSGRVTVAADSTGQLQIENRRGFGITVALYHTAYGE